MHDLHRDIRFPIRIECSSRSSYKEGLIIFNETEIISNVRRSFYESYAENFNLLYHNQLGTVIPAKAELGEHHGRCEDSVSIMDDANNPEFLTGSRIKSGMTNGIIESHSEQSRRIQIIKLFVNGF